VLVLALVPALAWAAVQRLRKLTAGWAAALVLVLARAAPCPLLPLRLPTGQQ